MPKVIFNNKNATFFPALKKDVDQYFLENGLKKTGNNNLYTKSTIIIVASVALYLSIIFIAMPVWLCILCCAALGFTLSLIGFNVMHDACHSSFSSKPFVNNLMGFSLNVIGGNSFLWKQKHNIVHHTYTNIDGLDDDIAKSPFIRMCESQPWKPAHKYQHIYLGFLYALSTIFWMLWQDFKKYFSKKIYNTKLAKMSTGEHITFWLSKVMYIVLYFIIPIMIFGWLNWLIGFLVMNAIMGLTTAVVFQLAHVVEGTEFEEVSVGERKTLESEWAVHQLKTTANFSPNNKVITYLVGGLNYQIEHHLFPKISHVYYPAISKIVKQKCEEYNVVYNCTPSFTEAVASHWRTIKRLGQQEKSHKNAVSP